VSHWLPPPCQRCGAGCTDRTTDGPNQSQLRHAAYMQPQGSMCSHACIQIDPNSNMRSEQILGHVLSLSRIVFTCVHPTTNQGSRQDRPACLQLQLISS
jgi:hypothetical protein